eukprot:3941284-Rhodomonas_salina.6
MDPLSAHNVIYTETKRDRRTDTIEKTSWKILTAGSLSLAGATSGRDRWSPQDNVVCGASVRQYPECSEDVSRLWFFSRIRPNRALSSRTETRPRCCGVTLRCGVMVMRAMGVGLWVVGCGVALMRLMLVVRAGRQSWSETRGATS